MPISGVTWPQPRSSLGISPGSWVEIFHNGEAEALTLSASKAKTLPCSVTTYRTFLVPTPGIATFDKYSGWASTLPSAASSPSFPNFDEFTFAGVSVVS